MYLISLSINLLSLNKMLIQIWLEPKSNNLEVPQSVALKEEDKSLSEAAGNVLCPKDLCQEVLIQNIINVIVYIFDTERLNRPLSSTYSKLICLKFFRISRLKIFPPIDF